MTLGEIYDYLDHISPFDLQEKWDNSGLLIGGRDDEIAHIILALDVTSELIETLQPKTLIIAHHPMIFSPMKNLDTANVTASMITQMIRQGVSHIAMHTNIDKTHLNRYVATQVLGWKVDHEASFVCMMSPDITFEAMVAHVKKVFSLDNVTVIPPKRPLKQIALTTGSGGSLIAGLEADLFITGDLKYHEAMVAYEKGMGVIDVTHYASERFFGLALIDELKTLPINVTIRETKNPMTII